MAKRRFRDVPEGTTAWVKATILSASLSSTLACGGGPTQQDQAPTCGPCCHGGGPDCETVQTTGDEDVVHDVENDREDALLEDQEVIDDAPTCGPCCHGSDDPECDDY